MVLPIGINATYVVMLLKDNVEVLDSISSKVGKE